MVIEFVSNSNYPPLNNINNRTHVNNNNFNRAMPQNQSLYNNNNNNPHKRRSRSPSNVSSSNRRRSESRNRSSARDSNRSRSPSRNESLAKRISTNTPKSMGNNNGAIIGSGYKNRYLVKLPKYPIDV